jgi:hypothetical protein
MSMSLVISHSPSVCAGGLLLVETCVVGKGCIVLLEVVLNALLLKISS